MGVGVTRGRIHEIKKSMGDGASTARVLWGSLGQVGKRAARRALPDRVSQDGSGWQRAKNSARLGLEALGLDPSRPSPPTAHPPPACSPSLGLPVCVCVCVCVCVVY